MTLLLKDPAAVLDYAVDWGAEYLDTDDELAESEWSVDPDESGGVAVVAEGPRDDPPTAPVPGDCYIVSDAPSGAWAGKPQTVAGYTAGGWRFFAPTEGMILYVKSSDVWANYCAGAWDIGGLRGSRLEIDGDQVVGGQAAAIASPAGGATIDGEARATIDLMLDALRHHGLIAP